MTAATPLPDNPQLDAALAYGGRGWRVVPIIPGEKRPPIGSWTDVATTDADKIRSWWGDRYAGHGVGIVCGWDADHERCLFVLDVDEGHVEGISGGDTLADLEARHGTLPATMEVVTGSGGRHLYFVTDVEIRNDAGRRLGPGLDVRGEGGQVLAPPTFHPNGTRYEWEAASLDEPAEAPRWLVDLLVEPERVTATPTTPTTAGDRPGDEWGAATSWADILTPDGWQLHHIDRDGEHHWTRPGKERREGTSATTGYLGSDVLKVFTSSVPTLEVDQTYTKIGYLAATRFGGDFSAAARHLVESGWGARSREPSAIAELVGETISSAPPSVLSADVVESWPRATADEIRAVLEGSWKPPTPTILRRTDGAALLYPGKVHSLGGEPGAAKTWIALAAVAEVINAGGSAMLIDHEDRLDTAVRRLVAVGAGPEAIVERFDYRPPTFAIKGGGIPLDVIEASADCALVVIDSLGEALAHSQLNQNDDGEVAGYMARAARRLADGGAAVLLLDHVTKDKEGRGRWTIGSQRKLASIDGAAYMATAVKALSIETEGLVKVTCSKDRGGNYQHGATVAVVGLMPIGDSVHITIGVDDSHDGGGEFLPTVLMERVSRYLEEVGEPRSTTTITEEIKGRAQDLRLALVKLVDLGFVSSEEGVRGARMNATLMPFRADEFRSVVTPSRPRPDPVPDGVKPTPSPVPAFRDGTGSGSSLGDGTTSTPSQVQLEAIEAFAVPDPVPTPAPVVTLDDAL